MMWSYPDTRYYYDWSEGLPPAAAHPGDSTIKAAVVDRLRLNPLTSDDDLRVDVKRGVVILQGIVGSRLAKRATGDDCWDTPGVTDVSNQLEVADAIEQGAGEDPISTIMSTNDGGVKSAAPAAHGRRGRPRRGRRLDRGDRRRPCDGHRDRPGRRDPGRGRGAATWTATTLASISSSPVLTVDREAPIADVVRLVRDRAVRRIVVTESGDRPVGVVSLGDLARPGAIRGRCWPRSQGRRPTPA